MSDLNIEKDSTLQIRTKSNNQDELLKRIREKIDHRHWQLFETRLKNPLPNLNKENYTNSNDYRVIDRFDKADHPQPPIEPTRRWEKFCDSLTDKSNETTRVLSIFHNVWNKNWNNKQQQERANDSSITQNRFINHVPTNDHDRKVISSILHQT